MGRPPLPVGTFGKIDFLVVGKGRVRARASVRDFDGRRRFVTRYGSTRAHAERRLREALRDRNGMATPAATADSRLAAAAALWLAEVEASELAAGTKRLYRLVVDSYVLPRLGELRLREVTVPAVDRLLTAVRAGHGAGAAKSTRSVLSGILALAVRHGALPTNPVRETTLRRTARPTKTPRALTVAEAQHLRKELAADPEAVRLDLPEFVDLTLGTGVRIGEACAVRPTAVDLDAATLAITATVVRVPGRGLVIQEVPKSDTGRRTIALPPVVVGLLRRRCAAVPPDADPPVLFRSPQGRLRDPNNTSGDLRSALDRAGFDWVTSHTFRKTVATRLDEAGLSARQIADHLGHTRPSLTQDVYMGRRLASPEAAAALQRTL
ncbi:Site-specific recombinase XerD [Geodermatophilus telluris]|uniref:Site-specific recombinase XerD n=1 Tax=Geodermatophilus telluris TaxID=1190417 RepID=A0A1G6QKU7_9ACTN|nr:site-specific integrase [Geodermatophilus telluris]SDC92295.1 Site-specific recombinase XerD [Geodermatophilus telluris]